MIVFGIDIRVYFLLFMIYAVAGWCMEVICKLIECRKFVNRGFLIGPYCPIYGYGALLITFLLKNYTNDPIVLFIMAIVVCGTLEYLTSYFMEKIFKARWWDYSHRKFNLNGRVCFGTIIPFGLLGLFIMYVSNPFLLGKIELLPEIWINILFWTLLAVYIVDNIVSGIVMKYIKKAEVVVGKDLDNTEEITLKVKEILQNKSVLHRRLVNAFPKLQAVKIKIKEKTREIKDQVQEQKTQIEAKVGDTAKKVEKIVEEKTKKTKQTKNTKNTKKNDTKNSLKIGQKDNLKDKY